MPSYCPWLIFSILSLVVLTVGHVLTVRYFLAREREWRERERALIDRLLKREGVQPIAVEAPERVVKLADPDVVQFQNPINEVFMLDEIKEDLEQIRPEARSMTLEQAQMTFPQEWARVKASYDRQHQPLRMG